MGPVGRVIDIEHNVARVFPEAGAEQVDQLEPHSRQITPGRGVLQPRQGRLGGQRGATARKAFAGDPERRVMTQRTQIVAILIPAGNREMRSRIIVVWSWIVRPGSCASCRQDASMPEKFTPVQSRAATARRHQNGRVCRAVRQVTGRGEKVCRHSWRAGFSVGGE